jgi:hypothetical protein
MSAEHAPRVLVPKRPTWVCSRGDCGGMYTTVQVECVCGGRLVSIDDLFLDRTDASRLFAGLKAIEMSAPEAISARIREHLNDVLSRRSAEPEPFRADELARLVDREREATIEAACFRAEIHRLRERLGERQ